MASIIESLMGTLSGNTLNKISKQTGVPEDKARQALPDIMAVLTGALAKNASQKQEAKAISNALKKDHDGSILNNLSDYISNYKKGDGNGILEHVLGNNRPAVEKGLSQKTGLSMGSIGNLLTMAAPLIMGALGNKQRQQGFDLNSLTNILGSEQNQAQNLSPEAIEILNQILSQKSQQTQQTQQKGSILGTNKRKGGCASIIIVIVIAVVIFFVLRSCGIV